MSGGGARYGRTGRLVLAAILLLALWDPPVPAGRAPLDLIVVVDDSASMPGGWADAVWRRLAETLSGLPAESRLAVLRFAARPALEHPPGPPDWVTATTRLPRAMALDDSATDLEAALRSALALATPDRPAAVLLLSDGRETRGEARAALRAARATGVPVHAVTAPPAWPEGPRITAWQVPAATSPGVPVPIGVGLSGPDATPVELVLLVDGREAYRGTTRLESGTETRLRLWAPPLRPGPNILELRLWTPGDGTPTADSRTGLIQVRGPDRLLYVQRSGAPAPLAEAAARGGWTVQRIAAGELGQGLAEVGEGSLVVLDDLAVADAPESAWAALAEAVTGQGTGLLVLGGPRSFTAGGYAGSRLEALLPVLAAPPTPGDPAAVLFLVDASGSMAQDPAGRRPLAFARQAVLSAAGTLQPGDQVGLVHFDRQPRELLALGPRDDPAEALAAAWQATAGGGTALAPALERALERLGSSPLATRVLILITDGFLERSMDPALLAALAEGGIEVVVVAAGDADLTVLETLVQATGGTLLSAPALNLAPRLLRTELARRRVPAPRTPAEARILRPLPFSGGTGPLPPWEHTATARARPEAIVYLASDEGVPLVASGQAGLGRVLAIPPGFGPWGPAWPRWPHWDALVAGMLAWLTPSTTATIQVRVLAGTPADRLQVDLGGPGGWETVPPRAFLADPRGTIHALELPGAGPGRFAVPLPATGTGLHRLRLETEAQAVQQYFWRDTAVERQSRATPDVLAVALREGLVLPRDPHAPAHTLAPRHRSSLRPWLLPLVLLLYPLLLVTERGLLKRRKSQL